MHEIQMLIPVADNSGGHFGEDSLAVFEEVAIARLGGFTRYQGTTHGGWANGAGVVYRDEAYLYGFTVRGLAMIHHVVHIAEFAKIHFHQEAIFVRYFGVVEIL